MQVRYQAALRPDEPKIIYQNYRKSKAQQRNNRIKLCSQSGKRKLRYLNRLYRLRRLMLDGGLFNLLTQAITCTANCEPLAIKKLANTAHQQDFVMLVITTISSPFHRLKLSEFLLPITKHMRLDATQLTHFTNREIAFSGDRWQLIVATLIKR